jgi:hypothetical protein
MKAWVNAELDEELALLLNRAKTVYDFLMGESHHFTKKTETEKGE